MHILYAVRAERGEGEEEREKNSEPTAKGEGDTVGRKKEVVRETEGNRKAKVLEIRVIENFVIERRGDGIYTTFLGLFSRRKFSRRGTPLT